MRERSSLRADVAVGSALGLVALLVAWHHLGHGSIAWWDEGFSAERARQMLHHPSWFTQSNGEPILTKPPLYYALAALSAAWLGLSELSVRLPSALFGAVGVVAVFAVVRAAGGARAVAVIAALLLLGNPHWINMAREARLESATGVAMVVSLHLASAAAERRRRGPCGAGRLAAAAGVVAGLGAVVKNPLTLVALLCARPWRGGLRVVGACALGFVVGGGWWFAFAWLAMTDLFVDRVVGYDTLERFLTPVEGHRESLFYYHRSLAKYAEVPYAVFGAALVRFGWVRRVPRAVVPHLLFTVVWLALLHAAQTRLRWYLTPVYPSLAIVGAFGLTELLDRLSAQRRRVAAILIAAAGLWMFAFDSRGYDRDLDFAPASKAFATSCAEHVRASDEIVSLLDHAFVYAFYLDHDIRTVRDLPARPGILVLAPADRVPAAPRDLRVEPLATGDGVVLLRLRPQ
ncbi:MAG: glycosyltransferase family 39 protein [Planctomycetes bacterium]|nr:glycosyltransferase family 39 protein [Planctomycetota bacterium]